MEEKGCPLISLSLLTCPPTLQHLELTDIVSLEYKIQLHIIHVLISFPSARDTFRRKTHQFQAFPAECSQFK